MLLLATQTIVSVSKNISIWNFLMALLSYIFLMIDSIVYTLVSKLYVLFLAISQFKIFDNNIMQEIINRTYIVVGVISLFIIAYALINAIINPENAGKSDKTFSKVIKNFVFAIIGVAMVPTIFNWFYYFQKVILCNNTIPKLLLKMDSDTSTDISDENLPDHAKVERAIRNLDYSEVGPEFATYLFQSFFYPSTISDNHSDLDTEAYLESVKSIYEESGKTLTDEEEQEIRKKVEEYKTTTNFETAATNVSVSIGADNTISNLFGYGAAAVTSKGGLVGIVGGGLLGAASRLASWFGEKLNPDRYSLNDAYKVAEAGGSFWGAFKVFILGDTTNKANGGNSIADGAVTYLFILSTVAGGYCAYVLLNMCIDMALRAVKLGYLEIIAPFTIMTVILPGKDTVFKTWKEKSISCALEVFVRVFIMSFTILIVRTIPYIIQISSDFCGTSIGYFTLLLLRALLYCGLLTFAKKAPKFFSEVTGVKSDGFKLGIADKLGEMALIGGAAKSGLQRAQGAATGALGGLATGLGNRDKIGLKSAIMQGATQGFKGKGNQFSNQRKSTFQSIGEYEDKDQGLFGGESKVSKFINDHKKDVKKDYTEYGTDYKNNIETSKMMDDLKTDANFGEDAHNKRMQEFADSAIMKQAIDYAKHQQEITGVFSEKAQKDAIATFLEKTRTTTQDKDLARSIYQFQKEQAADEIYRSMSKYTQEEKVMSGSEIEAKISDIKSRQKNIPIQRQHLDDTIQASQSKIDELRKSLAEHKDEIPQSVQDYMNNQINNLNAGIEARRKAISNLESENRQLSVDAERLGTLRDDKDKYVSKINEMAVDVLLGNGSLDVSGRDYITQLNDTEKGRAQEYRGFDAGIKTANKVSTTDDYLKELIDLSKKNNKE